MNKNLRACSSAIATAVLLFSSVGLASDRLITFSCNDGKNRAVISFAEQILSDICNDRETEKPEITFAINYEPQQWSPAPLIAMCAKPIKKSMLQFRKSMDEQIYMEIAHDFSTITANFHLNQNRYNMNCQK